MLTGSVINNNLTIYSTDPVVGINTNYFFVFNNNVFDSITSFSTSSAVINLLLLNSAYPSSTVKVNIYPNGLTTGNPNLSTSFTVTNNTIFLDNTAPSLFEMIEQNSYNYTSYIFSNYITGITSSANFPSANVTLKRNPPIGNITINEGLLGPMQVHRFAALSSTFFSVGSGTTFNSLKSFACDYNSYGDQSVKEISFTLGAISTLSSNAKAYISINQDYFNSPSPVSVGISTIVDFSKMPLGTATTAVFSFSTSIILNQGKYWIIFTPTADSNFSSDNTFVLNQSIPGNLYSSIFYISPDGITLSQTPYNGLAFNVVTDRGIVLPTIDTIYNQLNQPQNTIVQYGDQSNLNIYTSLAIPNNAHYIKKQFYDNNLIYAIETLVGSNGQNQFEVLGVAGTSSTIFYSMIANSLTSNVERIDLYNPCLLDSLSLISLGDYYAQSSIGNVLVSASDFIGISTVEISTSLNFPTSGTTSIVLSPSQQTFISNLPYNFGDLGKKFSLLAQGFLSQIKYIYLINNAGNLNYVILTTDSVFLYDGINSPAIVFNLVYSVITTSVAGSQGIVFADTLGNIYNYSLGAVTILGKTIGIPMSSSSQLTSVYIGVGTQYDSNKPSNRKRIYQLSGGTLSHQFWSTQIPEPEISCIASTPDGLIIGSYDQNNAIGKIYIYINSVLTQVYTTFLRPDAILYSDTTNNLYVGFDGSQILYFKNNSFIDTGVSVSGTIIKEISLTKVTNKIFVATDINSYVFDELTFISQLITQPSYSLGDQQGLLIQAQSLDLNLTDYSSTNVLESFGNLYFDPLLNGFNSNINFKASGFIVFNGISTVGIQTNFFLQIPLNSTLDDIKFNNQSISTTMFSGTFFPSVPQQFSVSITGSNIVGVGTIALYNGIDTTFPIVGIQSFTPPKILNYYVQTGGLNDVFGFSDASIRNADMSQLSSNQFNVYARFTDVLGNRSDGLNIASDYIYNQIQQQNSGQSLPTGRIVQIDTSNNVTSFTPIEGNSNFIYAGSKIVRQSGYFESDPFFAADVTSWNEIQVLASLPGYNEISPATSIEYGVSVTLYVKTGSSLSGLNSSVYLASYSLSTINNGNDFGSQIVSLLGNINSLSGSWLQFKVVMETASINISPSVISVLITYNGSGTSVFVTKNFNTSVQSSIVPTPQFRRGILTANYVTNGGTLTFAYTTDPSNTNVSSYTTIIPNQVFNLPSQSSNIKFGVILKTATSSACFFDSFGVQMDLGPNNLYFMPPQASFSVSPYYDQTGSLIPRTYQLTNTSLGIVSSYNWSFGTTGISTYYPLGINTFINPPSNSQNPIVQFSFATTQTVGLFITGWAETTNNSLVMFNSENYTQTFLSI